MTDKELIAPDLPEQIDPSLSDLPSGWHKVADSDQINLNEAIQVEDFAT